MHSLDTLKEKEEEKKKYRRRRRNSHSRPTQPLPRLCWGLPCTINSRTFFLFVFFSSKTCRYRSRRWVFFVDRKDDATREKLRGCVMSRMDVLSSQV